MWPWLIQLFSFILNGGAAAYNRGDNAFQGFFEGLGNYGEYWKDFFTKGFSGENMNNLGNTIGDTLNNITGANAANKFSHDEAVLAREHATAEREAAQAYNSSEAQLARDFQLMYDSTAMQRRVSDMEAAGLNPMAMFSQASPALGTASGSSAATSSGGSSSSASAAGNSASALSGIIRAIATLVKAAK